MRTITIDIGDVNGDGLIENERESGETGLLGQFAACGIEGCLVYLEMATGIAPTESVVPNQQESLVICGEDEGRAAHVAAHRSTTSQPGEQFGGECVAGGEGVHLVGDAGPQSRDIDGCVREGHLSVR
jgi:hypothetical protein